MTVVDDERKDIVVSEYEFEIVTRRFDRYSWLFVELDGRHRNVLIRAERDYRSFKKALRAICRFQEAVGHSPVVDATDSANSFPLPDKEFDFDRSVLPLIVDESPVERPQPSPSPRLRRPSTTSRSRSKRSVALDDKEGTSTPANNKPTTDKPTTDKPTTDKPTTDKPTTDKPTTDKPTDKSGKNS